MNLFENIPTNKTPEIKAAFYVNHMEFVENHSEIYEMMMQKHYQLRLVIWEDGSKKIKMLSNFKNKQLKLNNYLIDINNDGKIEKRTKLSDLI